MKKNKTVLTAKRKPFSAGAKPHDAAGVLPRHRPFLIQLVISPPSSSSSFRVADDANPDLAGVPPSGRPNDPYVVRLIYMILCFPLASHRSMGAKNQRSEVGFLARSRRRNLPMASHRRIRWHLVSGSGRICVFSQWVGPHGLLS
jgi:hypothetical protein